MHSVMKAVRVKIEMSPVDWGYDRNATEQERELVSVLNKVIEGSINTTWKPYQETTKRAVQDFLKGTPSLKWSQVQKDILDELFYHIFDQ